MIDTKALFLTMSLSMFATPYKEEIQKIYDEQKAAGMLDVEEGEFEEGIQFLMPLMTVEQKETLRKIEDHYHIMWDYAAEHGFLCGVVHAFERFFASGNDYHYDFTDSTWRSLYQPQFGYQHKSYCQAASEIRRLLDKLDEQLDESGQYHLISIELGYDQRVYIVTVEEILLRCPRRSLQCGNDLAVIALPVGECRLILENDEESPRDRLTGADGLDQVIVVFLQFPALGICFTIHVTLNRIQMLADVGFLGHDLHLNANRADFQPTGEGVDDVLLFPHASKQEVDRFHLQDFDVSAIFHVDDTVANILHRDQIVSEIDLLFAPF